MVTLLSTDVIMTNSSSSSLSPSASASALPSDHNNNKNNQKNHLNDNSISNHRMAVVEEEKNGFDQQQQQNLPRNRKFESMNFTSTTVNIIRNHKKIDSNSIDDTIDTRDSDQLFDATKAKELYQPFVAPIVWRNVATMSLIHVLAFIGWYLSVRYAMWKTLFWMYAVAHLSGLGVLTGAHRLWTHRSYKAHWTVRLVLMIFQTIALQNDIYEWARDHRVHHKYSETDADPHNSKRGFFFAHVGWLLCRKHPLVKEKGSQIDMSDVWADPIVRFQRRFYIPLILLWWGVFPVIVPMYFWNENFWVMFCGNFFRYVASLHQAWLVNSAAHIYGYQPYDKTLEPRENSLVVYLSMGEGYHNYHHTFPWDYSASEYGWRYNFNVATAFIDLFAAIGLVTNRRTVSRAVIDARIARTGDERDQQHNADSAMKSYYYYTHNRKPVSVLVDTLIGIMVNTWILWSTFLLQYWFYIGA